MPTWAVEFCPKLRLHFALLSPPGEESTFIVRKEYDKLVRDGQRPALGHRIPNILSAQQVAFSVEAMTRATARLYAKS